MTHDTLSLSFLRNHGESPAVCTLPRRVALARPSHGGGPGPRTKPSAHRNRARGMIHAPKGLAVGNAGDLVPYRAAVSTSAPEQDAEQGAEPCAEPGVPSLHELCSRVITDCYLSPKTVCEVMDFATAYHVPMLQRRVEWFVRHAWAGVRAANDPERLRQGEHPLPPTHLRRTRVWLVCRTTWAR